MAPRLKSRAKKGSFYNNVSKHMNELWKAYVPSDLVNDAELSDFIPVFLIVLELFVTTFIIEKVPYTEIDWKAYMQEVEGVWNGTYDYMELSGDTGPLVYPGGFVYIFLILYGMTSQGRNVYFAQYMFAVLYLGTLFVVFKLYRKSNKIPSYALVFMCCTSYRIHSIYVLRLFNDPVAIFFLFVAILCFVSDKWTLGCIAFSFAVSIKMNIMLFAPGLLYLLLSIHGLLDTVKKIGICGFVQFIVGFPFLITNPISYISRAFNIGRIFLYQWTVNWRIIPEHIFVNRYFHVALLIFHVLFLCIFFLKWNRLYGLSNYLLPKLLKRPANANYIISVLFISNFVGIVFCRSLHYQFYVWYFFTLPYLLWSTSYTPMLKLLILGMLELSWNTYPSTVLSSFSLHMCHFLILGGLLRNEENCFIEDKPKNC